MGYNTPKSSILVRLGLSIKPSNYWGTPMASHGYGIPVLILKEELRDGPLEEGLG